MYAWLYGYHIEKSMDLTGKVALSAPDELNMKKSEHFLLAVLA